MRAVTVESFHAVLFCREWEACVSFYRDVLGFGVVDSRPGFVEVEVAPGSRIGLIRHTEENETEHCDTSLILSFRVGSVEEIHKILSERCREVTAVRRHTWGALLFELRDPEGRRLEFWTPE